MTFSPRDNKDVSKLVAKKLERYMNVERRESRFDTQGYRRTTSKMHTLDLMYNVLESTELDKPRESGSAPEKSREKSREKKRDKSSSKQRDSAEIYRTVEESDLSSTAGSKRGSKKKEKKEKKKKKKIQPEMVENSRRVVSYREAERLTDNANKIFKEQPLDKLQVIHRYRPHSNDVPPIVENGRVQNYSHHVGSALHAKTYVDFYMKEGLQTGKREYSKRLQRLGSPKKKGEGEDKNRQADHGSGAESEKRRKQTNSNMQEILSSNAWSSSLPHHPGCSFDSIHSDVSSSGCSSSTPRMKTPASTYSYAHLAGPSPAAMRGEQSKQSLANSARSKGKKREELYMVITPDPSGRTRQEQRAEIGSCEDYARLKASEKSGAESERDAGSFDLTVEEGTQVDHGPGYTPWRPPSQAADDSIDMRAKGSVATSFSVDKDGDGREEDDEEESEEEESSSDTYTATSTTTTARTVSQKSVSQKTDSLSVPIFDPHLLHTPRSQVSSFSHATPRTPYSQQDQQTSSRPHVALPALQVVICQDGGDSSRQVRLLKDKTISSRASDDSSVEQITYTTEPDKLKVNHPPHARAVGELQEEEEEKPHTGDERAEDDVMEDTGENRAEGNVWGYTGNEDYVSNDHNKTNDISTFNPLQNSDGATSTPRHLEEGDTGSRTPDRIRSPTVVKHDVLKSAGRNQTSEGGQIAGEGRDTRFDVMQESMERNQATSDYVQAAAEQTALEQDQDSNVQGGEGDTGQQDQGSDNQTPEQHEDGGEDSATNNEEEHTDMGIQTDPLPSLPPLPRPGEPSQVEPSPSETSMDKKRVSSATPNRADEQEGLDIERGEDELPNPETTRGKPPEEVRVIPKPKRGDEGIVSKPKIRSRERSSRRRGNYCTYSEDDRGLEKEYFLCDPSSREIYTTSSNPVSDDTASEVGSRHSSRPSSARSQASQATLVSARSEVSKDAAVSERSEASQKTLTSQRSESSEKEEKKKKSKRSSSRSSKGSRTSERDLARPPAAETSGKSPRDHRGEMGEEGPAEPSSTPTGAQEADKPVESSAQETNTQTIPKHRGRAPSQERLASRTPSQEQLASKPLLDPSLRVSAGQQEPLLYKPPRPGSASSTRGNLSVLQSSTPGSGYCMSTDNSRGEDEGISRSLTQPVMFPTGGEQDQSVHLPKLHARSSSLISQASSNLGQPAYSARSNETNYSSVKRLSADLSGSVGGTVISSVAHQPEADVHGASHSRSSSICGQSVTHQPVIKRPPSAASRHSLQADSPKLAPLNRPPSRESLASMTRKEGRSESERERRGGSVASLRDAQDGVAQTERPSSASSRKRSLSGTHSPQLEVARPPSADSKVSLTGSAGPQQTERPLSAQSKISGVGQDTSRPASAQSKASVRSSCIAPDTERPASGQSRTSVNDASVLEDAGRPASAKSQASLQNVEGTSVADRPSSGQSKASLNNASMPGDTERPPSASSKASFKQSECAQNAERPPSVQSRESVQQTDSAQNGERRPSAQSKTSLQHLDSAQDAERPPSVQSSTSLQKSDSLQEPSPSGQNRATQHDTDSLHNDERPPSSRSRRSAHSGEWQGIQIERPQSAQSKMSVYGAGFPDKEVRRPSSAQSRASIYGAGSPQKEAPTEFTHPHLKKTPREADPSGDKKKGRRSSSASIRSAASSVDAQPPHPGTLPTKRPESSEVVIDVSKVSSCPLAASGHPSATNDSSARQKQQSRRPLSLGLNTSGEKYEKIEPMSYPSSPSYSVKSMEMARYGAYPINSPDYGADPSSAASVPDRTGRSRTGSLASRERTASLSSQRSERERPPSVSSQKSDTERPAPVSGQKSERERPPSVSSQKDREISPSSNQGVAAGAPQSSPMSSETERPPPASSQQEEEKSPATNQKEAERPQAETTQKVAERLPSVINEKEAETSPSTSQKEAERPSSTINQKETEKAPSSQAEKSSSDNSQAEQPQSEANQKEAERLESANSEKQAETPLSETCQKETERAPPESIHKDAEKTQSESVQKEADGPPSVASPKEPEAPSSLTDQADGPSSTADLEEAHRMRELERSESSLKENETVPPVNDQKKAETPLSELTPKEADRLPPATDPKEAEGAGEVERSLSKSSPTETKTAPSVGDQTDAEAAPSVDHQKEAETAPSVGDVKKAETAPYVSGKEETITSLAVSDKQETETALSISQQREPETVSSADSQKEPEAAPSVGDQKEAVASVGDLKETETVRSVGDQKEAVAAPSVGDQKEAETAPSVGDQKEAIASVGDQKEAETAPSVGDQKEAIASVGDQKEAETAPSVDDQKEAETAPSVGDQKEAIASVGDQKEEETASSAGDQKEEETASSVGDQKEAETASSVGDQKEAETASSVGDQKEAETVLSAGDQKEAETASSAADQKEAETVLSAGDQKEAETASSAGDQKEAETAPSVGDQKDAETAPSVGDQKEAETVLSAGDQTEAETVLSVGDQKEPEAAPSVGDQKEAETAPSVGDQKEAETVPSVGDQKQAETVPSVGDQKEAETVPSVGDQKEAETVPSVGDQKEAETVPSVGDQKVAETAPYAGDQKEAETVPSVGDQKEAETVPSVDDQKEAETAPSVSSLQGTGSFQFDSTQQDLEGLQKELERALSLENSQPIETTESAGNQEEAKHRNDVSIGPDTQSTTDERASSNSKQEPQQSENRSAGSQNIIPSEVSQAEVPSSGPDEALGKEAEAPPPPEHVTEDGKEAETGADTHDSRVNTPRDGQSQSNADTAAEVGDDIWTVFLEEVKFSTGEDGTPVPPPVSDCEEAATGDTCGGENEGVSAAATTTADAGPLKVTSGPQLDLVISKDKGAEAACEQPTPEVAIHDSGPDATVPVSAAKAVPVDSADASTVHKQSEKRGDTGLTVDAGPVSDCTASPDQTAVTDTPAGSSAESKKETVSAPDSAEISKAADSVGITHGSNEAASISAHVSSISAEASPGLDEATPASFEAIPAPTETTAVSNKATSCSIKAAPGSIEADPGAVKDIPSSAEASCASGGATEAAVGLTESTPGSDGSSESNIASNGAVSSSFASNEATHGSDVVTPSSNGTTPAFTGSAEATCTPTEATCKSAENTPGSSAGTHRSAESTPVSNEAIACTTENASMSIKTTPDSTSTTPGSVEDTQILAKDTSGSTIDASVEATTPGSAEANVDSAGAFPSPHGTHTGSVKSPSGLSEAVPRSAEAALGLGEPVCASDELSKDLIPDLNDAAPTSTKDARGSAEAINTST